jgi:3-hydroxyisobutyrate dehydrogenase-like beta-hydroxyacid dehydrogenase
MSTHLPESGPTGTWGFIGLGEMGEPMVASLLSHGVKVSAYDRDPARVRLSAARGALAGATVGDVARGSDLVSVCVRDAGQVEAVVEAGLAEAASPSTIVLIHSTIGPRACRAIATRLATHGATVLDAPVSGMRMAAAAGTLTFFVGGPGQALERARTGLEAMGQAVVHVGDVGAGQVVKIANNAVAFVTAGIVNEVLEIARKAGVDDERVVDALRRGSARSWVLENWAFLMSEWARSQPGGAAAVRDIVDKDLTLARLTADELGLDARFASLAASVVPGVLGPTR